jgi:hypothetical protein
VEAAAVAVIDHSVAAAAVAIAPLYPPVAAAEVDPALLLAGFLVAVPLPHPAMAIVVAPMPPSRSG